MVALREDETKDYCILELFGEANLEACTKQRQTSIASS